MPVSSGEIDDNPPDARRRPAEPPRASAGFAEDFRRFFLRGLAALLPTLITLWLLRMGVGFPLGEPRAAHHLRASSGCGCDLAAGGSIPEQPAGYIGRYWSDDREFRSQLVGVLLAILLVYIVGLFVGNFIGRTLWRMVEDGGDAHPARSARFTRRSSR